MRVKRGFSASSMYTNKHAWTNKDGTYKEVYYYICGRNKQERGRHCDYKASLRKTDIEPLVIEAVKELVSDKYFAKEIEKRKEISILKMYDAMRKKGGLYIIDKSKGEK